MWGCTGRVPRRKAGHVQCYSEAEQTRRELTGFGDDVRAISEGRSFQVSERLKRIHLSFEKEHGGNSESTLEGEEGKRRRREGWIQSGQRRF